MKKLFFSGVKYKIQAVNQERLLTSLSNKFALFFVKRLSYTQTELFLKPANQKVFEKELKEKNVQILQKRNTFLYAFFKNFIKKTGVIAGLFLSFVLLIIANQFIFQTSILGLESIEKQEVLEILKQNDFDGFVYKASLNTKKIESAITKNFDNISLVSVIVKGNTLVVSIKEKISAGDYDHPEDFKPLTAKYNGLITNISLISGTLKVKVGQIVRVGDVLVEPYILDSSNNKRVVKADAEISARVWLTAKETHFEKRHETTRTGKTETYSKIYFLGIALNSVPSNLPFENYEIETRVRYIAENNILPIVRQEIVYYELETKEIIESFESVKEKVFEKAKQKALQMLEEYDIITKEYFTINSNFGVTNVEYVIEINKLIN